MIKKIIFDLDDTLIDWKEEYWASLSRALDELHITYDQEMLKQIRKSIDIYEDGRNITYNKEKMLETINHNINKKLPTEFMDIWTKYLSNCVPEKIEDEIYETLKYLKEKYELVILSNWLEESQINRMKKVNLIQYFTNIYMTEGIPMKPNKEAFHIARGETKSEECVMIGDSIRSDIMPATELGIRAIHLNRKHQKINQNIPYQVIKNIKELKSIL